MWRNVLLCLFLTLSGCTWFDRSGEPSDAGRPPPAMVADSPIMRRVMGQNVPDQPLLPQPGNIWADVLPAAQDSAPAAIPASGHGAHRPAVAAAPSARPQAPVAPAIVAAAPAAAQREAPAVSPAAAVAPVAPVVAAASVPRTAYRLEVQLAAAHSAKSAEAEWRRLRQHARKLTEGRLPAVSEAEVNGQRVWRLRAAGFADVAEASAFCTGIRAVKADCWVVPPSELP